MEKMIIDVRERDEYAAEHVPGSMNLPLTELHALPAMAPILKSCELVLMCRSGNRAKMAKESFDALGVHSAVYAGGIQAWKAEGLSTQRRGKTTLSLFRQVQIVVGAMVIGLSLLAYFSSSVFALGAAAVGGGLFFAGVSGMCLLASVLKALPWNKVPRAHA
jgi:rhodanese-related sulfurtransferase